MKLVAFDLGTRCGVAVFEDGRPLRTAALDLRPRRHEGGGMRFVRFRASVVELLDAEKPDLVAYEEVRRHLGVDAAHIYGGLLAVLTEECERRGIPYTGVPVGAAKRAAAGKGNAPKDAVRRAVEALLGAPVGEDEADAVAVGLAVVEELTCA